MESVQQIVDKFDAVVQKNWGFKVYFNCPQKARRFLDGLSFYRIGAGWDSQVICADGQLTNQVVIIYWNRLSNRDMAQMIEYILRKMCQLENIEFQLIQDPPLKHIKGPVAKLIPWD